MGTYYALLIVLAAVEVIRYETMCNNNALNDSGRIAFTVFDIFIIFILILVINSEAIPAFIPNTNYSGLYTICFIALAMDISIIIKLVKKR